MRQAFSCGLTSWVIWALPVAECGLPGTDHRPGAALDPPICQCSGTLLQSLHTRMVRLQLSEMAVGFHVWLWKNLRTSRNNILVWGAGRCIRITNLLAMGWHPTNALDWHTKCQPCLYWHWLLSGHFLSWHHSCAHHFLFSLLGLTLYTYMYIFLHILF